MSLPDSTPGGRPPPTVDRTHWRRGAGIGVPVLVAVVILAVGILSGRVEVAGLALPVLLSVAWSLHRRPDAAEPEEGTGRVEVTAGDHDAGAGRIGGRVVWRPGPRSEQLRVTVSAPGHTAARMVLGRRPRATDPAPDAEGGVRAVPVSMRSVRTGRRPVFGVEAVETCAGQVRIRPAQQLPPIAVTVLPTARGLRELPLPPRLQGLTGPHGSTRAGDGGDLRDINLFLPGDRLRRIDWRVTARHAGPGRLTDLYVRRTFATADATVMLVLDSRDEVGADVRTWGDVSAVREDQPTSLDHARDAAATVARSYLEAGDRVGLDDLGRLRRPVPPAGGRRQLDRLRQRIAVSEPDGEPKQRRRVPRLPSGCLIVLFSTFLDDEAMWLAQQWRSSGHRVVAVDVLPVLRLTELDPRQRVAYRIVAMERRDRLAALARSDVEVVRWLADPADPGQPPLDVAMTALARRRVRR